MIQAQRPSRFEAQSGAIMAYVLGLMALLALLVGLLFRYVEVNDALVARERNSIQARYMALSGLEYALYHIKTHGPERERVSQSSGLDYQVEGLRYWVEPERLSFSLSARPFGLFTKAISIGAVHDSPVNQRRGLESIIGQSLNLGEFPALALLNKQGNLVLAGTSEIRGPVMLWKGSVRKSTNRKVAWKGRGGHEGALWDSTSQAWDALELNLHKANRWIEAQEETILHPTAHGDPDYDSASMVLRIMGKEGLLADSLYQNIRFISAGKIHITRGARLRNCQVLAARIRVDGDAHMDECLLYAMRKLEVLELARVGGQYLARDSMTVNTKASQSGYPIFYVHGNIENRGQSDSIYKGNLSVERYSGEGIFLFGGRDKPAMNQDVHLHVSSSAKISGLIYAQGLVQMEGNLEGSLICENLKFEYAGTIWFGHLKDAVIRSNTSNKIVRAPFIFPLSQQAVVVSRKRKKII